MNTNLSKIIHTFFILFSIFSYSQYSPDNLSDKDFKNAKKWVDHTYNSLTESEKLGQLFIVALYVNKGDEAIMQVRNLVEQEHLGGLILMQDDAKKHIQLLNEFQKKSKVKMLIGMDAEWGLYQRIAKAQKFPWAITLGAIQDKNLIKEMASKIAADAKRMGVNWNFAPVVDVNTNPSNPIIGNRSFGSNVENVVQSALAYSNGLQENQVLAAIKHFPGHGDTDTDSHLDLPLISHQIDRLNEIELAPFKSLMNKGIGGVMVAHLYVPALESQNGIPASVSKNIVTGLLKEKLGFKGLIITDALNMGAVSNKYKPGELEALAFEAGNDIMLFSEAVAEGKKQIEKAIKEGKIPYQRVEESVKKILLTKYFLGLKDFTPISPENIDEDLKNDEHQLLNRKLYSNAITLLKNDQHFFPLDCNETYYYIPLEEAPYFEFLNNLNLYTTVVIKKSSEINEIPENAKVIIGIHKDNSTAYKPYKISEESKKIIYQISQTNPSALCLFGSPYALKDIDIHQLKSVVIAYENNDDAMFSAAKALNGFSKISGKLPVVVNDKLQYGLGIELNQKQKK